MHVAYSQRINEQTKTFQPKHEKAFLIFLFIYNITEKKNLQNTHKC